MLNNVIIKLQNINLMDLLKIFFKRLIINGVKMTITYQISIIFLGYCILQPIFIRVFNYTKKTNVAECWSIFELPSSQPTQTLSGLTWDQILIGGIVMGITYYGIGYIGEKVLPPFIRYCGYDYFTFNEKLAMQNQKLDTVSEKVSALNHNLGIVNNNVDNLTAFVTTGYQNNQNGILHAQQTLVALTTEIYNRMGNIATNEIIPLKRNVESLMLHLGSIENIIQNQSENALSPDIFRTEMERLITLFNDEHTQISNNIRRVMVSLQEQVDSLDPNDLNQASERLQSHIAFLENVLRTHADAGTRVRETMQTTIEEVATQLEETQQQLTEASNTITNVSQESNYPTFSTESVLAGSTTSYASQQTEKPTRINTNTELVETSTSTTATTLTQAGANTGSYIIEQRGNEVVIRLTLSGDVNVPVQEMATDPMVSTIVRSGAQSLKNSLFDMAMTGLASGSMTLMHGALVGGLNGMMGSVGITPIMRLTSTPSTFLKPEQVEAAAKASDVGDKIGTAITIVKAGLKSAWKYI